MSLRDPSRKTPSIVSISVRGPKGGEAAFSPPAGVIPGRAAGLSSGSFVGPVVVAGSALTPRGVINASTFLTSSGPESPSGVGSESTVSGRGTRPTSLGYYGSHSS